MQQKNQSAYLKQKLEYRRETEYEVTPIIMI